MAGGGGGGPAPWGSKQRKEHGAWRCEVFCLCFTPSLAPRGRHQLSMTEMSGVCRATYRGLDEVTQLASVDLQPELESS